MTRLWSALRDLPVRIALLIAISFAVLIPLGLALERRAAERLVDARLRDMQAALAREMSAAREKIALAEGRVKRLAQLIGDADGSLDAHYAERFDGELQRFPDGTRRSHVDPKGVYEATIWVPSGLSLDAHQKALITRSREIVSQLGSGTIGETSDDVWFMTTDGAETVYVPTDPDYGKRDTPPDYSPSRWIDPVLPKNNPSGGAKWVASEPSPTPPIWFGMVVAPVQRDGKLLGVAGLDFVIGRLVNHSAWRPHSNGNAEMIIDLSRGALIAHGDGAEFSRARTDTVTVAALPPPLRDSLGALIERARRAPAGSVMRSSVGSRILLASVLDKPAWAAVVVIERAALVAPLTAPLRLMRFSLGLVVALLLAAVLVVATVDLRRERAIADLRARASERFNRLFQMLPVAVALTRASDGSLVEANDVARRLMGDTGNGNGTLPARALEMWSDPQDAARVRQQLAADGIVSEYSGRFSVGDGRQIDVVMSSRTIDVEETPHILTAVQDVSEQRRLEAQLVQSQKLEAVGRLAGGVAHDFNNLLTAVMGYCDLLSPTFAPNDARARDVAEIRGAAQRGATLTKQLLGFARQQTRAPREVELSTVVRDLRGLLRGLLTKGFDLRTELDRTAGTALIDPGQLEQVVTNLVVNARDAMPNGGPITIRTRREGAEILLEVTDAGTGIPAHVRPHIFEPFFTTKEVGKGSGLGLATCYGIVRQAAGSIRAFDAAHGGTTIQVRLPRVGERLDQSNESASVVPQSPPNGTRRVIVVEDDDMVRGVTRTLLERAGYQVEAMSGAPEALSRLLMDDAHFDLVVSDIVMPRMSGPAFARVLAATHPDLPILFMSGYTADETMREDIAALGHPFLAKPYTTEDLLNAAANAIPQ